MALGSSIDINGRLEMGIQEHRKAFLKVSSKQQP
ncbi:hypothetical protein CCACVL1_12084 [Corchorus capsularis]|uniref:Uncharacterized protein n=1 Tax=Corchorus capsularis TaxID=210143 RepID=A0A1R3IHM1_COCAP|nr:hypothetical protein CCACVL1_12084 [Corchorus capsularis]